jgi:hypothetical protein
MRNAGNATTRTAHPDRGSRLLVCVGVLAALLGTVAASRADEPATSTTTVAGDLPDELVGTWLMVGNGKFVLNAQPAVDRFRTSVEVWAIQRDAAGLTMSLVDQPLPAGVQTALDTANRELRPWTPSRDDVAEVARSLGRLPRNDPQRFLRHTHHLVDAGHLGLLRSLPPDLAAGAELGLEIVREYRPREIDANEPGAQLMRDQAAYAVTEVGAELAGQHVRSILAAGFVPIPITTRGPFRLYRLHAADGTNGTGLGARLGAALRDLFRGCR